MAIKRVGRDIDRPTGVLTELLEAAEIPEPKWHVVWECKGSTDSTNYYAVRCTLIDPDGTEWSCTRNVPRVNSAQDEATRWGRAKKEEIEHQRKVYAGGTVEL